MVIQRVVGLISAVALAVLVAVILRDRPPPDLRMLPSRLPGGVPATLYYRVPAGTPADALPTIFRPAATGEFRAGIVVAHGFAGDRRTMEALSRSLALAGYVVVSLDMSGHGANRNAFEAVQPDALVRDIGAGVRFLRQDLWIDPSRIAVLGHSMGAGAAMAYGSRESDVAGLVMLSGGSVQPGAVRPRNALFLYGQNDLPIVKPLVRPLAAGLAGVDSAEDRRTYGDFSAGTAVRLAEIPGAAHGTILASPDAFAETVAWLDRVTGFPVRASQPALVAHTLGSPLAWLAFFLVLPGLGLALGRLAPAPASDGMPARWRETALLPAALLLSLAFVAPNRSGILAGASLADANVTHLALAGLLLLGALLGFGRFRIAIPRPCVSLAVAAAGAFAVATLLGPVAAFAHGTGLTPGKALLAAWTAAVLAPLALAMHWLSARPQWWRGALLRIGGRIVLIFAVGVGLALGAFQFAGVIAIFVLIASPALCEPVLAGYYAGSRNLVAAAAFDALIGGWLFALLLPATY